MIFIVTPNLHKTKFLFKLISTSKYYQIKANAIGGRNEKAVREFLEKNWVAESNEVDSVRLTIRALLEVMNFILFYLHITKLYW